jgi:two-component system sensor histidine kinase/response regulator
MRSSYRERQVPADYLYRKPGTSLLMQDEVSGIPEGLRAAAWDELQRSQEQLREYVAALQVRNTELEAYAHMVAHDLRDPLTIIVTTSDLITHIPNLKRKELLRDLNQIRFTAYEMNRIINSLLLFAEVSKAEAPAERVNMAWVVANVWDRFSYIIRERKAQVDLPESWPEAIGYAPWIEEVWANYLSNALKHGGRPPRVELGASPQPDGMVRFWTRDNGPGLPRDTQANLFQAFNQTGQLSSPGHGLGLSIVHHIVEKLGGQAGVESELGKGSLFFFTLPAFQIPA